MSENSFTEAELEERAVMNEVVERMVRDVFLDCPEGTDSATVAANVTRSLWDEGYRKTGELLPNATRYGPTVLSLPRSAVTNLYKRPTKIIHLIAEAAAEKPVPQTVDVDQMIRDVQEKFGVARIDLDEPTEDMGQ